MSYRWKQTSRKSLSLQLSSSSTTNRELLSQVSTCSGWRWLEVEEKKNCHILEKQFHGNFHSKTLSCGKTKSVIRDVKWRFNAPWGLKGLINYSGNVTPLFLNCLLVLLIRLIPVMLVLFSDNVTPVSLNCLLVLITVLMLPLYFRIVCLYCSSICSWTKNIFIYKKRQIANGIIYWAWHLQQTIFINFP